MTKKIEPTDEQAAAIYSNEDRIVIKAGAGTGKTFTLRKRAEAHPKKRMLYIAYNRAIRDAAHNIFPSNVVCKTSHQVSFAAIGHHYADRLVGNISFKQISNELGIKNWKLIKDVRETLANFLVSPDLQISDHHCPRDFLPERMDENAIKNVMNYRSNTARLAEILWQRMIDPRDDFPVLHDVHFKIYQLTKPNLGQYHSILIDEAQDSAPVVSAVFMTQEHAQTLLVGDEDQQLYRFRGAVNSMESGLLAGAQQLHLTKSWRFGANIALAANSLLRLKPRIRPSLVGFRDDNLGVINTNDKHTVIFRTVMGVIDHAIQLVATGIPICWVGGIKNYNIDYLQDVHNLAIGRTDLIKNYEFRKNFQDFDEFCEICDATSDPEMRRAIKILEQYATALPQLISELKRLSTSSELAHVTLTTAHRAKGLEWPLVRLGDDFLDIYDERLDEDVRNDEINLLYVASTRAMSQLETNLYVDIAITMMKNKQTLNTASRSIDELIQNINSISKNPAVISIPGK